MNAPLCVLSYLSLKLFRSSLVTSLRMSLSVYSSFSICGNKCTDISGPPPFSENSWFLFGASIKTNRKFLRKTHRVYRVLVGAVKPQPARQLRVFVPRRGPTSPVLLAVQWRWGWGGMTNSLKDRGAGWASGCTNITSRNSNVDLEPLSV